MIGRGSQYKTIVNVMFKSGHQERILCGTAIIQRTPDKSEITKIIFNGCQYQDIHINSDDVSFVTVENNIHYDESWEKE